MGCLKHRLQQFRSPVHGQDIEKDRGFERNEARGRSLDLLLIEGKKFGPLAQLNGNGIFRAFIEKVLGRAHNVEVAEANGVVAGTTMGISLTCPGDRDLTCGGLEVDSGDDL
ncbi:MAG: hypothetical protein Q8P64_04570, partial [Deltaproteobacteria bacterium]|nr:hypothetical protein [Deltaproteobacteria bacterium]